MSARHRNFPVRVPSAVLVELYRGGRSDESIDAVLARGFGQVVTTGARIARMAGHLLAAAGSGSEMAIDAWSWRPPSALVAASSQPTTPAT